MISRREIILSIASLTGLALQQNPLVALAANSKVAASSKIEWPEFVTRMKTLSERFDSGAIRQHEMEEEGLMLISRLDIGATSFRQAENNAFESGNAFWLWQRMIRARFIDGGILNIDKAQMIPLHDHPGATGMVRIISGEAEVWKFERTEKDKHKPGKAQLELVNHGVLHAGDTATVTPQNGNIHALRSVSRECRMLDFFIPPFERRTLLYFKPDQNNWFNKQRISCRAIPRNEFTHT